MSYLCVTYSSTTNRALVYRAAMPASSVPSLGICHPSIPPGSGMCESFCCGSPLSSSQAHFVGVSPSVISTISVVFGVPRNVRFSIVWCGFYLPAGGMFFFSVPGVFWWHGMAWHDMAWHEDKTGKGWSSFGRRKMGACATCVKTCHRTTLHLHISSSNVSCHLDRDRDGAPRPVEKRS